MTIDGDTRYKVTACVALLVGRGDKGRPTADVVRSSPF